MDPALSLTKFRGDFFFALNYIVEPNQLLERVWRGIADPDDKVKGKREKKEKRNTEKNEEQSRVCANCILFAVEMDGCADVLVR